MIKLIGFDLDGTLFTDDKRITDVTRNTLAEAAERGVFIVPVTGRPYAAVPASVRELPGVRYMITASGAVIFSRRIRSPKSESPEELGERIDNVSQRLD